MLSTDGFKISKRKAKLPLGPAGASSYIYWSDVQRQWEWSYANTKISELIGSQSFPLRSLPGLKSRVGHLSESENKFAEDFRKFYGDIDKMMTTIKRPVNIDTDIYETILNNRHFTENKIEPKRVLDIGPGAGRNMVAQFLGDNAPGGTYVGIESVAMCYSMQNMVASHLSVKDDNLEFVDLLDYEFAPESAPSIPTDGRDAIYHLPLWMEESLPAKSFDLVICNYLLDELPGADFQKIVAIISRVLADDGVLYCRGSQQRAQLSNMYLYGMGTFHGLDITAHLLGGGLKCVKSEIDSTQITRIFARKDSGHQVTEGVYTSFEQDVPMLESMQENFIKGQIKSIIDSGKSVLVWGEPGYEYYYKYVAPHAEGLKISSFTNRWYAGDKRNFVHRIISGLKNINKDFVELEARSALAKKPDVIIIASIKDKSITRQISDIVGSSAYSNAVSFNFPVTFLYRTD